MDNLNYIWIINYMTNKYYIPQTKHGRFRLYDNINYGSASRCNIFHSMERGRKNRLLLVSFSKNGWYCRYEALECGGT